MTKRSKPYLFLLAAGLSVATLACGGGSSSMTGPDAPVAAIPQAAGATIAGTVQSGAAASPEIGASSVSDLRVSVTGTALQTTTDGSGRFTLSGVPSGRVELRFEGGGIDARLELEGLQSGQTLNVTVRVSGSSASRVDDTGSEVELRATVDSVGSSSLVVGGRTVRVDASTRLLGRNNEAIALSAFRSGDLVEVEGIPQSDGSLLAAKVKLEDAADDDGAGSGAGEDVEFTGTVGSLSPLTVAGRTVNTDGSTRYLGRKNEALSASDVLKVGNRVEVEGHAQSGGSVLAKKIKLED
jgi:hypothetical protein